MIDDAMSARMVIKRSEMIFNARRISAIASMIYPEKVKQFIV
jgi:hypothetical protein